MLRIVHLAPPVLAVCLLLAACGSSGPKSASGNNRNLGIAFARCMRANGVPNFPDPGSNGGGGVQINASQSSGSGQTLTVNGVPVSAPAFQAANQKCQKDLPKGGGPPISSAQLNRLRAGALAVARCMRAHGVPNFPDPIVGRGPGGRGVGMKVGIGGPGSGIDPSSPAFQSAQKLCGPLGGLRLKGPA
jgi:hypothetical protein